MIQFASLEKNVMFPPIPAELGRHGNTAALSLWTFFFFFFVGFLSVSLHICSSSGTRRLYWYSTPWGYDSCALSFFFLQSGTKRVVKKNTMHTHTLTRVACIFKSTGLLAYKGFALMPLFITWQMCTTPCNPHFWLVIFVSVRPCDLGCFPSLYIR